MRIGLFGGTFDPVHMGHLILAECCRQARQLDEVQFVPAARAPHKQDREPTAAEHRLAMLELATAGQAAFRVSRVELDRGGVSYTIDTLRDFLREDPHRELFFLVGADMLNDLPNWREAAEVARLATPVAVRRAGSAAPAFDRLATFTTPERIERMRAAMVEMPEIGICSSRLRRDVAAGRSIRYQTPRAVERYIAAQGLYRG